MKCEYCGDPEVYLINNGVHQCKKCTVARIEKKKALRWIEKNLTVSDVPSKLVDKIKYDAVRELVNIISDIDLDGNSASELYSVLVEYKDDLRESLEEE